MSFGVPFGAVQQVLAEVLRVVPERHATLLSRLRNMSRESFQPSGGIGRGQRAAYGVESLTAVVFYNYMIDRLMPPDPATRLYLGGRNSILSIVRETCIEYPPPGTPPEHGPDAPWLRICPGGLYALRSPPGLNEGDAFARENRLEVCRALEAANAILVGQSAEHVEVFDVGGVMWKVFAWLINAGHGSAQGLQLALQELKIPHREKQGGRTRAPAG